LPLHLHEPTTLSSSLAFDCNQIVFASALWKICRWCSRGVIAYAVDRASISQSERACECTYSACISRGAMLRHLFCVDRRRRRRNVLGPIPLAAFAHSRSSFSLALRAPIMHSFSHSRAHLGWAFCSLAYIASHFLEAETRHPKTALRGHYSTDKYLTILISRAISI
jgi:hypothetical protein